MRFCEHPFPLRKSPLDEQLARARSFEFFPRASLLMALRLSERVALDQGEIAEALGVSPRTVRTWSSRIWSRRGRGWRLALPLTWLI